MNEKKLLVAVISTVAVVIVVFAILIFVVLQGGFFSRTLPRSLGHVPSIPPPAALTSVFLPRPLGVFSQPDYSGDYEFLLGPGEFEFSHFNGTWAHVLHNGTYHWVYMNFEPPIYALQDAINALSYDVSVYFANIESGFTFTHRENIVYTSASINKVTHALYVYYLATQGLADLSTMHTLTTSDFRGGTGVMRHFARAGDQFTHMELLTHSVRDSDNTAFAILYRYYSAHTPNYGDFARQTGRNISLVSNLRTHQVTAADTGHAMHQIHNFFETGTPYALHFQCSMLNSDVPLISANYPIAQKYGAWHGAWHDAAIIYAPSPYILVIHTSAYDTQPAHLFPAISELFESFNQRYFIGE